MTTTTHMLGVELVGTQGKLVPIMIFTPANGPEMQITGLSENAAKELWIRLRSVLHFLEIEPDQRIGISVPAPATEGGAHGFDLPILIGILAHLGKIPNPTTSVGPAVEQMVAFGSLSLGGAIQPVRGAYCRIHNIPLGPAVRALWIIPKGNAGEAWSAVPTGSRFLDVASAQELVAELRREPQGERGFAFPPPPAIQAPDNELEAGGLANISPETLRVLEVAAASGAGLLLGGTTSIMVARFMRHLLPPLTTMEMCEVTAIRSAAMGVETGAVTSRPFRAPHHTVSDIGLVGSISSRGARPGEVTLAHRGILLLDELDEFRSAGVGAAFQAMGNGFVRGYQLDVTFPAKPTNIVATIRTHQRDAAIRRIQPWLGNFPLYHVPTRGSCTAEDVSKARARIARVWGAGALSRFVDWQKPPMPIVDAVAALYGDSVDSHALAQALLAERP